MDNEEAILKGEFNIGLLDKSKYEAQINDIIKVSVQKVYQSKEVVDKEISGYQVLNTLLHTYSKAVNNNYLVLSSNYDALILKGLPKVLDFNNDSLYHRLLNVCHYVSLMTDSQAILEYKKVRGFNL